MFIVHIGRCPIIQDSHKYIFVSVFSLLVYGIYNKNVLNIQHLFVFLSHPYEFNLGLGPSHCFGGLARPLRVEPDP